MYCPECGMDLSKPQPGPLAHEELESYTDWLNKVSGFIESDYSETCFECPDRPGTIITVRTEPREEED